MDENKLQPKPPLIRNSIILSLVIATLFFYSSLHKDPISDFSRTTCRQAMLGVIVELNGMENLRWANLKLGSNISFETDAAFEDEIVGTSDMDWCTNIGPHCEWDDGYPTPSGGYIVCEPERSDRGKRYRLFRTAATRFSPGSWSKLDTP